MKMKSKIEYPLVEPIYSTYHGQGAGTAIFTDNPSIRNWYLNEVMILRCSRGFLSGGRTPGINIVNSDWRDNPYIDRLRYEMKYLNGHIHYVIKNMLKSGYYVYFRGIDDYYVDGKCWYRKRHFLHDGTICGYNPDDKTYCIYSYDSNWIYQKFGLLKSLLKRDGRQCSKRSDTERYGHLSRKMTS